MTLRELIEILDERVELFVYSKDGLHTMHLYDKDYLYRWHEEFLKKKVIIINPREYCKFTLKVYLEDFYDEEEEIKNDHV